MTETQIVARLTGATLPDVTLNATDGTSVALARMERPWHWHVWRVSR